MVIRLTPDIETALEQQAKRQGTTPERLCDTLGSVFLQPTSSVSSAESATLFDFLSGYIGTVEGTGEAYSENCGERFCEGLVAKHERGHL